MVAKIVPELTTVPPYKKLTPKPAAVSLFKILPAFSSETPVALLAFATSLPNESISTVPALRISSVLPLAIVCPTLVYVLSVVVVIGGFPILSHAPATNRLSSPRGSQSDL
ncbi:MAG: hypothetical protein ACP5M5_06270, partial [Acidibrevibacterium sp.]|uniref:hypothetical protein n=1 Tax=Acidibrevibacterium sp. TaxID=2606776 RepID=UPI003D04C916